MTDSVDTITSYNITLGREYYSMHYELEKWCWDNVGSGTWTTEGVTTWVGFSESVTWAISCTFGYTTFSFRHGEDAIAFKLKW